MNYIDILKTMDDNSLKYIDLCARAPYHPKGHLYCSANGVERDALLSFASLADFTNSLNDFKLYLRKWSSLTEKERNMYHSLCNSVPVSCSEGGCLVEYYPSYQAIDYLNSIYIDYRGLINKGLALEAPEGLYKSNHLS